MTTSIYDGDGDLIAGGLQSLRVCDEALHMATELAAERDEDVYLENDETGEKTTVHADGSTEEGWDW